MSNAFYRRDAADIRKLLDAEQLVLGGLEVFRLRTQVPPMALKLDQSAPGVLYVGDALPGTPSSADAWRIKKVLTSGAGLDILWAYGSSDYAFSWDNRGSLDYS